MKLAFFGGIYNNYLALEAAISDARARGADQIYCLGDLGAFGPHPDRVFPLLNDANVTCIQGNYDDSIGNDLDDCQCGYTDPRDNHFAQISYDYTYRKTSQENRHWMRDLPPELRFEVDGIRFLLCHGSPRQTNEFLWESTTSSHFLDKQLRDYGADVIVGTHSGIHWQRELSEGRRYINAGVLGRPENDGQTNVWYTVISTDNAEKTVLPKPTGCAPWEQIEVEFIPLHYDHKRLAQEMRDEQIPDEFIDTIETGWWTTCLEVLPSKERRAGKW